MSRRLLCLATALTIAGCGPAAPTTAPATAAPPPPGAEVWIGEVAIPGMPLGFTVTLAPATDGWTGTIDIPLQGAKDVVLADVHSSPTAVGFTIPGAGAVFSGKRDGNDVTGTLAQSGQTFPMKMHVAEAGETAEPNRPQTPTPPFPYDAHDVTYPSGSITVAGTLTVPRGAGPHPAVLLITGSGAQDRDETIFGHKPFAVIADHLTRNGFAVLRTDDRGVGGTGGATPQATTDDLVGDVLAGVAFLKKRTDIDSAKIGVVGHSEGGIVGPMAAVASDDLAFVVMLAGTGLPGRDILMLQGETSYRHSGAKGAKLRDLLRLHGAALDALDGNQQDLDAAIRRLVEAQLALSPQALPEGVSSDVVVDKAVQSFGSPWFRSFVALDPRPALRKLDVPVLALNGELDMQVPPEQNLPEIRKALAHNDDVTIVELPGLNHLFQPATTGMVDEYAQIEQTIDPAVLDRVTDWLRARAGLTPR